jgi:hypothetical protein
MARKRRTYKGNLANLDREYPGTWQQAFQAIGSKFFNEKTRMAVTMAVREVFEARDRRGSILPDLGSPSGYHFVEDGYGHVVLHCSDEELTEALCSGRPFVGGADSAGDRASGDYHAATFLHCGIVPISDTMPALVIPHRQLLTIHGYMDGDAYGDLLHHAGVMFGTALLGIEVNGLGVAVLKRVRSLGYKRLYSRRSAPTSKRDKPTRELGWWSGGQTRGGGSGGSKAAAYGETERLFRNGWLDVRDPATLQEMGDVLTLGGGRIGARDPKHDDRPDGLVIAVAMTPYARMGTTHEAETEDVADFWSLERAFSKLPDLHKKTLIGNEMGDYMASRG